MEDRQRGGRQLALKRLHPGGDVEALRRELEVLATLKHPHLVELYDVELTGSEPYLTCSFVDGPDLATWSSDRTEQQRLVALAGVLRALCLLHDRGWVHGDLKPANILVPHLEGTPTLVDLGLAVRPGHTIGGTPGYASPEGISGGEASFRVDVYAFGVVALEILSGRRAFGDDPSAAVNRQMQGQSILREPGAPDLPPDLITLLGRCLEPEPSDRPADALQLLAALRQAVETDIDPSLSELDALVQPRLVGRTDLLDQAHAALQRAAGADGPTVLGLQGSRGMGKTRLLQEIRFLARGQGFACIRASSVHDALTDLAARRGSEHGPEQKRISMLLAGLLPGQGDGSPAALNTRRPAALFALALDAARRRPLLILLDDLHQLDASELDAVAGLIQALTDPHPETRRLPLVLILAADDEALCHKLDLSWIELLPLAEPEGAALLRSMLPDVPLSDEITREIWRRGAGNPWLIQESLLAWLRRPELQQTQQTQPALQVSNALEESSDPQAPYPDRVLSIAHQRLSGISGPARAALRSLSLTQGLEVEALHLLHPDLEASVRQRLVSRRIISEEVRAERLFFALCGDHLLQAVQAELTDEERPLLHARIADALEACDAAPERIAHHHRLAHQSARASRFYWRAARAGFDFRGQWALSAAELGGEAWPHRHDALSSAARALRAAGQPREALAPLQELVRINQANEQDRVTLGHLWIERGDPRAALEALGEISTEEAYLTRARALLLLGREEEARVVCESLPRSASQLNILGLACTARGELDQAVHLLTEAEAGFSAEGDLLGQARTANNLAIVHQRQGDLSSARTWQTRAMNLASTAGDDSRSVLCRMNRGTICHLSGEFSQALEDYERAMYDARRLGNQQMENQARLNLATIHLELGDPDSMEHALGGCRALEGLWEVFVLLNWAELAAVRRDFSAAHEYLQRARTAAQGAKDPNARVEGLLVEARLALAQGEVQRSAALAQQAREIAAEAGLDKLQDEALLATVVANRRLPGQDLEPLRGYMEDLCRRMERRGERGRLWRVYHELALIEALLGLAIDAAFHRTKAGQVVDEVLASLHESQHKGLLNRDEFREVYAATRGRTEALSATEPVQLDSDMLLKLNLQLARVRDPGDLVVLILDKAIELTGAQRGLVILLEEDRLRIAAARNVDQESLRRGSEQFSKSVAQEVMATGQSVITVDAQNDERFLRFESVSVMKLRSVICAPLKIWGAVSGAIYLDNRFRNGAFTPQHVALLEGFGVQAGLALDTARLLERERRQVKQLEQAKQQVEDLSRELEQTIHRQALALDAAEERARAHGHAAKDTPPFEGIIGRSAPLQRVISLIRKTSHSEIPVYIYGESGTGKELVAHAIHRTSPRGHGPLITINCGGLSAQLLASELFGHVKGAFTGATRDHPGLIRTAEGGTLFLDEVTEMSSELQVQLLRVLQSGDYRPVGGDQTLKANIRIISASNLDMEQAVQQGSFREDLSYRLNVLRLDLPPLRQRREDIPLLVQHLLGEKGIRAEALRALLDYDWPGNVRELNNELMRAAALTPDEISLPDLSSKLNKHSTLETPPGQGTLAEQLAQHERRLLLDMLEKTGNATQTARKLGLSRAGLYKKLARYGIQGKRPQK